MLLCALCACVVSVIGVYFTQLLLVFCPFVLLLVFYMFYKSVKGELILAAILILLVSLSTLFSLREVNEANLLAKSECSGEFVVIEEAQNRGNYYSTTLEVVSSDKLKKGSKIAVTYNKGAMEFAERINATINLGNFDTYKNKYSFYSQGVYLKGYIEEFSSTYQSDGALSAVARLRNYIKETIFKAFGRREAATMLALVAGNKDYFTNEFYSNVKSAGVAHVMVVSGMHLSVMVSLALYLANKLFYNRFFKAFVLLFVTFAVMVICGFTMSIMRAGVTYLFMALALIAGRENTPENTLGAAVSMILLFNPFAIFNVAFQLSVLSTFSILVVALPLSEYIVDNKIVKHRWLSPLVPIFLISFAALIFTAPITIYIFGYVSNVSLLANLLITAATSMAINLCLLGFIIPPLRPVVFLLSVLFIKYVNYVINYLGSLPFAVTPTPQWTAFVAAGIILAILWILVACKERNHMVKLSEIRHKKYNERGKVKWHLFTKKRLNKG